MSSGKNIFVPRILSSLHVTMSTNSNTPASLAQDYISNPRFHQHFTLDPTATHAALDVTYAEFGREADETSSVPTILLMPGMFASRFLGLSLHPIATKLGVRVLVVDRYVFWPPLKYLRCIVDSNANSINSPGMGGSSDVPLAQRVSVWVETVPRLLAHLGIQHVALASHSAGTIYLFNTLYHCRDLLYRNAPVTLLGTSIFPSVDRSSVCQSLV